MKVGKKTIDNGKQPLHSQKPKQTWEPKDNLEGIGSSKAFASVHTDQQDASIPEKVLVDKDATIPAQHVTSTDPHALSVTEYTDGRIIELVLLDNDVTAPAQQHVAST